MTLLQRPHLCSCKDHVDIVISLAALRSLSSYDALREAVEDELKQVYGQSGMTVQHILYSTDASESVFASELNAKIFDTLKNYDDACTLQAVLESEYTTATQELDEVESHIDPNARRTKKEREEDAERRNRVRTLKKQSAAKAYEVECLQKRLANVFQMRAVRVQLQ